MTISRVFVAGATAVVVSMLVLPFILSTRHAARDTYKDELAAWHVRWSDSRGANERAALLPELDEIRPPVGSVALLDRHRVYEQAHIIMSQADELATMALRNLANVGPSGEINQNLTCENLYAILENPPDGGDEFTTGAAWADEACSLRSIASKQLSILRVQALLGWLRGEIREYRASLAIGA